MNWIETSNYGGPDRRRDHARRRLVAQMTRDELLKELLTDPLTGCLSLRAFQEVEAEKPASVLVLFDVDGLKWINDTLGHQAGDALLKAFVRACYEEKLMPFRIGGDEFAIRLDGPDWTPNDVWSRCVCLQRRFRATVWAWQDELGKSCAAMGAGVSFGFAKRRQEAEAHLNRMKQIRELAGTRSQRGERPRDLRVLSDDDVVKNLLSASETS